MKIIQYCQHVSGVRLQVSGLFNAEAGYGTLMISSQ